MSDDCAASVNPGAIRFYDNLVPTLGVGDYLVNVTQRVNPQGTSIDECWAASQAFSVEGPRYTLPPADVFSVFPPPDAVGQFEQSMPNVVFTLRDLPWERNVFGDTERAAQTPWLALLLFVAGEQIGGQDALLPPDVAGWTQNPTMSAIIPAADFYSHPAGDGILWPALTREWYESDDYLASTGCTVIDVAPPAFAALLPDATALRYLAHARQVDATAKDSQVLGINGDGWYSVVMAPRLPDPPPSGSAAGQRNICHLVSLEGLEGYVGGAALPEGTTRVRMISLQSWSFTCQAELGESFSELMNGLLVNPDGTPKPTSWAVPYDPAQVVTPAQRFAASALAGGYVPLRWQTRLGEQSFAWYRGPFSTAPVAAWVDPVSGTPARVFGTASAAMVYDPAYGVFDLSYAVAWETGRLQALSDPWFGKALTAFQQQGHQLVDMLLERARQAELAGAAPGAPPAPETADELLASVKPYAWTGGFVPHLLTTFSVSPAETGAAGDQAPPAEQPIDSGAWTPAKAYPARDEVQALLADPAVQAAVQAAAQAAAGSVAGWLSQRYLLVGTPFEALVPRADLLPPESIRFFWVDPNWIEVSIQGALSIGIGTSRDALYQQQVAGVVRTAAQQAAGKARAALTGQQADDAPRIPVAGMLLRSAAVTGWPGMEVRGWSKYTTDAGGEVIPDPSAPVDLLRLERLSGEVMIALWAGLPAVVTVAEPAEGISFGFEDPPTGEGDWLYLRSTDPDSYGMPLCTGSGSCEYALDAVAKGILDPATRVVAVSGPGGAVDVIQAALPGQPTLAVRDFAVQMVRVPEQAVFAAGYAGIPQEQAAGTPQP